MTEVKPAGPGRTRGVCSCSWIGELASYALIARHARPDETTAIDGVLLSAAGRPGEPRASTTGTVMAVIAQGSKRLAIGDRVYDYGPASTWSPRSTCRSPGTTRTPPRTSRRWVRPDSPARGDRVTDAGRDARCPPHARPAAPAGSASPTPRPSCSTPSSAWCACSTARRDRDILAPMIEREILWRLINGPLGESVRQIGLADSSLTHVEPRGPLDHRALRRAVSCRGPRSLLRHEHVRVPPQLPRRHRAQPYPVPEADPPAEVAPAPAHRR